MKASNKNPVINLVAEIGFKWAIYCLKSALWAFPAALSTLLSHTDCALNPFAPHRFLAWILAVATKAVPL